MKDRGHYLATNPYVLDGIGSLRALQCARELREIADALEYGEPLRENATDAIREAMEQAARVREALLQRAGERTDE